MQKLFQTWSGVQTSRWWLKRKLRHLFSPVKLTKTDGTFCWPRTWRNRLSDISGWNANWYSPFVFIKTERISIVDSAFPFLDNWYPTGTTPMIKTIIHARMFIVSNSTTLENTSPFTHERWLGKHGESTQLSAVQSWEWTGEGLALWTNLKGS